MPSSTKTTAVYAKDALGHFRDMPYPTCVPCTWYLVQPQQGALVTHKSRISPGLSRRQKKIFGCEGTTRSGTLSSYIPASNVSLAGKDLTTTNHDHGGPIRSPNTANRLKTKTDHKNTGFSIFLPSLHDRVMCGVSRPRSRR
jgi:hypothetical protein